MLHPAFSIERLWSLMQRSLQYGDGTFRPTALSPGSSLRNAQKASIFNSVFSTEAGRAPYSTLSSVWRSGALHIQLHLQYGRLPTPVRR